MDTLAYDWRKHASQVISDDQQVERAFMDQAYQFLANKGNALMKDPYRLGFEIVHKNDTNTRMVGIFAFRVGSTLIYVPVFFLNGEIKGTDLLYRHDSKTFVPYEDKWIKYIISKSTREMGRGISSGSNTRSPKDINLEDIAFPPGSYGGSKSASEGSHAVKYAAEILESIKSNPGSLLKQFILEDGGFSAITKLAYIMDSSFAFAEAVANNIPEDCIMPAEMAEKMHQIKQAEEAAKPKPSLVLSVGGIAQLSMLPAEAREKAAANMAKRGYNLWDDRDSGDAKVTKPVYRDAISDLTEVSEEAGYWDIMMTDGSTREGFVAVESTYSVGSNDDSEHWPSDPLRCSYPRGEFGPAPLRVVFSDGSTAVVRNGAYGELKKDQREAIKDLEDAMKSNNAYCIFDAEAGTLSDPIYVVSKNKKGGITFYKAHNKNGRIMTLRHNPDIQETQLANGVLGRDVYFIKVKSKNRGATEHCDEVFEFDTTAPEFSVGSGSSLREWCLDNGVKEASLFHKEGYFQLRESFRNQSNQVNRATMAVKLASQYGIHADTAEELLDEAETAGKVAFLFGDPLQEKSAAMTTLKSEPRFQTHHNGDFNVDMEYPQQFALDTETEQDEPIKQNIGDAFDPSMGFGPQQDGNGLPAEQLMNSTPEQLAQLAQGENSPQIFEHGVVGTLVQTYDSVSMIDKYLPDMEQALDKLGRLLFLFYWKPRDFEDAYGADDMTNMENQILSNFRSFGELVLELLKKSDTRRKGSVSLAGE